MLKYYIRESQQVYVREEHKFINTHFVFQTLGAYYMTDEQVLQFPLFDKKTSTERLSFFNVTQNRFFKSKSSHLKKVNTQ